MLLDFSVNSMSLPKAVLNRKLQPSYANQWLTTLNASYAIWNWIEVYGDVGF